MTAPLSADLGRLALPPRAAPFEAERIALLDHLIQAEARGELTPAAWEAALAERLAAVRDQVLATGTAAVRAGAARSRYPESLLRERLPSAEAGDALLHRLLACAMPVEALAEQGDDPAARRARGAALEGAWEAAMAVAAAEGAALERRGVEVAAWIRPVRPRIAVVLALALLLALTSAWLGGQLPAPPWFAPIHTAFWSLPWP